MFSFILATIVIFISTNIDDLFLLMILYSQLNHFLKLSDIILGQYLSLSLLILISYILSLSGQLLPSIMLNLLGIIPLFLGIKAIIQNNTESSIETQDILGELSQFSNVRWHWIRPQMISVAALGIASGGDNIGVYVPIFMKYNQLELLITLLIFSILIGIWCLLGYRIYHHPSIKQHLTKYQHILYPLVLIAIGLHILIN